MRKMKEVPIRKKLFCVYSGIHENVIQLPAKFSILILAAFGCFKYFKYVGAISNNKSIFR